MLKGLTVELAAFLSACFAAFFALFRWLLGREARRLDGAVDSVQDLSKRNAELREMVKQQSATADRVLLAVEKNSAKSEQQIEKIHDRIDLLQKSSAEFHVQIVKDLAAAMVQKP